MKKAAFKGVLDSKKGTTLLKAIKHDLTCIPVLDHASSITALQKIENEKKAFGRILAIFGKK